MSMSVEKSSFSFASCVTKLTSLNDVDIHLFIFSFFPAQAAKERGNLESASLFPVIFLSLAVYSGRMFGT